MWTIFLLLSCSKQSSPNSNPLPPPPIVPGPESSDYACAHSEPRDPMVARVSRGQPWDEALSGAAAGVGLALGKEIKMAHLKWAAVVAGYPSVPQEVLVGTVPIGDYPDGLPQRLESFSSPSDDVGIVRLRKGPEDLWVSVRATGCGGFASFPREYDSGETLKIEGFIGNWRLLEPDGNIISGSFPVSHPLTLRGEYWLEINSTNKYQMPLYVDMHIPPTNIFDDFSKPTDVPEIMLEQTFEELNEMRQREGLPQWTYDGTLSILSARPSEQFRLGEWTKEKGIARLQGAGFVGGPAHQMICQGDDIGSCLDALSWELDDRAALLNAQLLAIGIHLEVDTDGLLMVISLASI